MADIVLVAFNARYAHTSFGARYLLANMGELKKDTELLEFDLQAQPRIAVEKVLAHSPRIVGMGCYIWNIELATKFAALLKSIRPDIKLILGGPEISYETECQEIFRYADHAICGEGEAEFPKLCRVLLSRQAAGLPGGAVVPQAARLPGGAVVPQAARLPGGAVVPQAAGLPGGAVVPQAARLPETTGFHPYQPVEQTRRKNLPHWEQDGCTYFVTFRLADSIPQLHIKEYEELRRKWEDHHQPPYSEKERERFNELFSERVNEWLDAGAGSCCLRNPEFAAHVAESLRHFDRERYELGEWVVMPNHVYVLVRPLDGFKLSTILHTWKSYSAHAINKALNRKGQLWQTESYDHIVRNLDELVRIRDYIRRNPEKAGLDAAFAGSRRAACDTKTVPQAAGLPGGADVPQAARLPGGADVPQAARLLRSEPVDVTQIELPYDLYTADDIAHRAIYVEASRGCPFQCEYCMSSLDASVRYFHEANLFSAFQRLLERGARNFKFVDRTFNIDIAFALRVLDFFRERYEPGMMLHFEMIPDRLPDNLMDAVKGCPPGMLQFEIGIQTFNEAVARRIKRPLDIERIESNMRRLRKETGVHIHADLIAGLPGEDLDSFASGFNRLLALNPQEIQVGILKRLRGAPIDRHTKAWSMVYSPHAPHEILQTNLISFEQMQRVQRFARYWDLTVNNGRFIHTAPLIWRDSTPNQSLMEAGDTVAPATSELLETSVPPASCGQSSTFAAFMEWSDWLYDKTGTTGNLHMVRLAKLLLEFLTMERGMDEETVAYALLSDYRRGNRPDVPGFLKQHGFGESPARRSDTPVPQVENPRGFGASRQSRHQGKL